MSFNYDEEEICGHKVTSEMKKLWAVEMDLARKLIEVCNRNGLKIYAEGGTLLGAVRHKGFIPWDDDIDFVMFRKDYEKLIDIAPEEFCDPYYFQTFGKDNVCSGISKLRRNDTTMIDTDYNVWKQRNYGVFVDVIVMDALPDDKAQFEKQYKRVNKWERLLTRKHVYKPDFGNWRATLRTILTEIYFFFNGGEKRVHHKMLDLFLTNESKNHKYCGKFEVDSQCPYVDKVQRRNCEWYNETVALPFHDMMMPAPKEYDKVLVSQYGKDYMTPIMAKPWHAIAVVDCERPYEDVLKDLNNKK